MIQILVIFLENDKRYRLKTRQKTKQFQVAPENKLISKNDFNDHMKKIKPKTFLPQKELLCDWTDKRKYLVHYSKLKIFIWHVVIVVKVHAKISFEPSEWLEKYINFNTQKKILAENVFKKRRL